MITYLTKRCKVNELNLSDFGRIDPFGGGPPRPETSNECTGFPERSFGGGRSKGIEGEFRRTYDLYRLHIYTDYIYLLKR